MTIIKADKRPHALDVTIGARVRLRRKEIGLSQSDLARGVGIAFQQIQKYERGANRICISRLAQMCEILQCSLFELIGDLDLGTTANHTGATKGATAESDEKELLQAFASLNSGEGRLAILRLARELTLKQKLESAEPGR